MPVVSRKKFADELFKHFERFEMTLADMKGLKQGKLSLVVVTTAKYFAPRLLGPFCQLYPGIDVKLKVTNRERVLERLARNEDDLYILGQPPEDIDVIAEPFLDNPLVVLTPANHPLTKQKKHITGTAGRRTVFIARKRLRHTRRHLAFIC